MRHRREGRKIQGGVVDSREVGTQKGQDQHAEGRTYVGNIRAVSREMDRSPGSLSLGLGQGPCMRVGVDKPGVFGHPSARPRLLLCPSGRHEL